MTTNSLTQITVPFHSAELLILEHEGQPYIPMRPIVEGMGLDWATQFRKLNQKFKTCVVKMTTQLLGDNQTREVIMMALKKLPAFMYSIESNKVKPELRDTVIMYQNECDDVLWDYWTKGQAINHRVAISPEQQALLHEIVDRRSKGERKIYAEMWSRHNRHFKIPRYAELLAIHFPESVHYLETMAIKAKPEKQDNGGPLDSLLPEYGSNLVKMEHIIQEFIREDTLKDFENANSQLYLDFISRKFDNMSVQDRKLLSEVAYSLAQKNEISE